MKAAGWTAATPIWRPPAAISHTSAPPTPIRTRWTTSAGPRRRGWRCAPAASWGWGDLGGPDRHGLDLAALGIGSIPLNILRPIPGTPFGDLEPIPNEGGSVLRAVAIFRYLNPTAWIRMAAGRGQFSGGGAGAVPLWGQRGHHRGYAHHHRDQHGGGHGHAPGPGLSAVKTREKEKISCMDQMTSGAAGQKNKTYALAMTALMAAVTCVAGPHGHPHRASAHLP